jgi:thiamine-phosphate pyrophosphorylase
MRVLAECRLYGIVDLGYISAADVERITRALIAGGVDIIQLRGKNSVRDELVDLGLRVHSLTSAANIPLIINDHPEVARDVTAEGVHVGQDDIAIAEARRIVRDDCTIGRSTHSIEQAVAAEAEGADYIGFGPLFSTPTKPDYEPIGLAGIREVHDLVRVPIFCIGGVKLENLADVISAGAERVVIVSGLLLAPDAANYARSARALLGRQPSILNS